ncbi:hypothetical protein OF117_06070 [Geodermatophilus sp. YIM 151500]|uniref:hypothetical protein n=1 Tax=Geodermatophilus sp. YIM 151500 TaxID=2984531 RepID=UPI0021E4C64A|nr:hypothetical protein [Geodermatophilus sp. YIM 151500]MCV2488922.1 hypothetical protein [Geodermatophilus sp. YIM 151500]
MWAAAAVLLLPATGCDRAVDGVASAAPVDDVPEAPADLEPLIVSHVPSELPRLADTEVEPPAGPKTVEDVAQYADDPARERAVLAEYGYRWGWERFWGTGSGALTGVFVDQFAHRVGADAYAADLAANEADRYGGLLQDDPPELPGGCWLLVVDGDPPPPGLTGPAALSWCGHGVFSVSVTAVAGTTDAAREEVRAVLRAQLQRLPPR